LKLTFALKYYRAISGKKIKSREPLVWARRDSPSFFQHPERYADHAAEHDNHCPKRREIHQHLRKDFHASRLEARAPSLQAA
jgi:hypothetical protein